ncbi:uncharacterized protein TNIN_139551 [Trichonephila inaurata madagascariensis]|uniref:Uncharacterized protein n=1 Tax=Trichonephila inaurata madagascariensis TaxID=2747483 RepID=A0A8X7CNJ7_9ARAC|nr:uncharacterized protein TNIN_139551 [Trichonephila inaurata madagascariensis]
MPSPAHEEVDTKTVHHACNINYPAEIVIRVIDTYIAAIMLDNMHPLKNDSVVWMLTGTGNNLRYVDLTKLHEELGQLISHSLPGYHAITGCDFNHVRAKDGTQNVANVDCFIILLFRLTRNHVQQDSKYL